MKIIGEATGGRMLVEASLDELSQLTGYSSNWYRERENKKKIGIGDEVNVSLLFKHFSQMKLVSNEIIRAKGIIDTVSAGLMLADTLINKAVEKGVDQ